MKDIDPTKQDMYVMPLMGIVWHLWRAGSPTSVCGLQWAVAAQCFDAVTELPDKDVCEECVPTEESKP